MVTPLSQARRDEILNGDIPARLGMIDLCRVLTYRGPTPFEDALLAKIVLPKERKPSLSAAIAAENAILDAGVVSIRALLNLLNVKLKNDLLVFSIDQNSANLQKLGPSLNLPSVEDILSVDPAFQKEVTGEAVRNTIHFASKGTAHILEDSKGRTFWIQVALACWITRKAIEAFLLNPLGRTIPFTIGPQFVPLPEDCLYIPADRSF